MSRQRPAATLRLSLAAVNAMDPATFVRRFGPVFEHAPWVAEAAHEAGPFASVAALHAAMAAVVDRADPARQRTLLAAHPELARPAALTAASATEQGGLGLDRLDTDEAARFDAANAAYRARFGFPFVIAVRGHRDRTAILAALQARLAAAPADELRTALAEVARIAAFRLADLVEDRDGG